MILSIDNNNLSSEELALADNNAALINRDKRINFLFEEIVTDRVTEQLCGEIEAIGGTMHKNLKMMEQVWTSIERPMKKDHSMRLVVCEEIEKFLMQAKVDKPVKVDLKRRMEQIK